MRRLNRGASIAAAVLTCSGCIAPTFPVTHTEVIRASDSSAVFGPGIEVRVGDMKPGTAEGKTNAVLRWDPTKRTYLSARDDSLFSTLRVARLQGDSYLLQAETTDGYKLVPMRVSPTGDASPLSCDLTAARARAAGVGLLPPEDEERTSPQLMGTRSAIIAFLNSELPRCTPMLKFVTFIPPTSALPSQRPPSTAAANNFLTRKARLAGCRPCKTGACITGLVEDESGQVLPGATVSVFDAASRRDIAIGTSNAEGRFFITGVPAGAHRVQVALSGFGVLTWPAFTMRDERTYAFEKPFALRVAAPATTISDGHAPLECPVQ